MIVHKFGGTSLGTAQRISSVVRIIETSLDQQPAVVVSALSGTTDRLIAAARAAARGDDSVCQAALSWLGEKHHSAAEALLLATFPECRELHGFIDEHLERLGRFLHSIAVLGELTARGHDAVACFGEKLSAAIVATTLRSRGISAQAVSSTDLIRTNDRFGSAIPQMEATRKQVRDRVLPLMKGGVVPIITGYIGSTADGIPTTLGRSGSDFSAAIVAACLDCDELRIWTDVDGILTADPNVVSSARVLRELSYEEATRLARFGAEVLHPRTIGPIIEKGIPLCILNSFNPADPGTRIVQSPSPQRHLWPAIVSATGLQLLRLRSHNGPWQLRMATTALARLDDASIPVRMFSQSFSEQGINLVVGDQDAQHSVRLLSQGVGGSPSHRVYALDTIEQVATVSVIGLPGDRVYGIAVRAFAALGKREVRVVAVAQEAAEDSVTFCIPAEDVADTVRFLHRELGLENGKEEET
ncbi:aspartate kinase [Candidatus Bipolaricaulota bacterium]|nr:aspartate kinase [Candidatus Bipolaricaulota bacterium]